MNSNEKEAKDLNSIIFVIYYTVSIVTLILIWLNIQSQCGLSIYGESQECKTQKAEDLKSFCFLAIVLLFLPKILKTLKALRRH